MHPFPGAITTKLPKIVIHRGPRTVLAGQIAPGAASADQIEQSIENAPNVDRTRPAPRLSRQASTREERRLRLWCSQPCLPSRRRPIPQRPLLHSSVPQMRWQRRPPARDVVLPPRICTSRSRLDPCRRRFRSHPARSFKTPYGDQRDQCDVLLLHSWSDTGGDYGVSGVCPSCRWVDEKQCGSL
jgi:hypothetical protein